MTLPCKRITVTKSKEVKNPIILAETSKESYGSARAILTAMMTMTI
jgi:hypothetical protein